MAGEPVLVGREAELAVVAKFLEQAGDGPAVLVLRGPAGIGKTTVWRAGVETARTHKVRVLTAEPAEPESTLTFAGLIDLLEPFADEVLPRLPDLPAAALSRALRRRSRTTGSVDPVSVSLGVLGALRVLAADGPLLVAIDDLQWLDPGSVRAVAYAVRRLTDERVGVLCAWRHGHAAPNLGRGTETTQELEVGPLPLAALDELLRRRLGVAFLRPTLVRIEGASGGNPFLAIELGRALLRRGIRFAPEELPIPDDIGELLAERLRALSADAMAAVLTVAVLSRPALASVMEVLKGLVDGPRALDEAVRSGVLQVDREAVAFSHPLLAAVAATVTSESQRQVIHRRAARVAADPEERARHLAKASSRPNEAVANSLEEAARSARQRGSPETAADLARLALQCTPADQPDAALRRGVAAARHLREAGDPEAARALLGELLGRSPAGPPRAEILVELYHATVGQGRRRLVEEAIDEAGNSVPRIDAEASLADLEWEVLGDVRSGLDHARLALRFADRIGDPQRLVDALAQAAWLESIATGVVRHDLLQRAQAVHAEHGAGSQDFWIHSARGLVLAFAGDLDGSREAFETSRAHALQTGNWAALPLILRELAVIEIRAGNWPLALDLAQQAEVASRSVGSPSHQGIALVGTAQVLASMGQAEAARQAGQTAEPLLEAAGAQLHISRLQQILGFIELSLGNAEAAHAMLGPAIEQRLRAGVENPGVLYGIPDDVEALVALGRLDEADAVLRPFEQAAARLDHRWALATGRRARALITASRGDTEDAIRILNDALTVHDDVPEPFERARTLLVLGEVQRRTRQRGAAARSLRAALREFERLGAALWAKRASRELVKVDRTREQTGLTETDRLIVELVSIGRTNRQIAGELFMSPHTVDTHLRRIFRTVGVHNRAQLAGSVTAPETLTIHENA